MYSRQFNMFWNQWVHILMSDLNDKESHFENESLDLQSNEQDVEFDGKDKENQYFIFSGYLPHTYHIWEIA